MLRAVFCVGIVACSLFYVGIACYLVIELSSVHISQKIIKRSKNVQKIDATGKKTVEFANQRLKSSVR